MVRSATIFVGVVITSFLLVGTATGAEPRAYQVLTEATVPRAGSPFTGAALTVFHQRAACKRLGEGDIRLHAWNGEAVRADDQRAGPCRHDSVGSRPRRPGRVGLDVHLVSSAWPRWEAAHSWLYGHDHQRRRYEGCRGREARLDSSLTVSTTYFRTGVLC